MWRRRVPAEQSVADVLRWYIYADASMDDWPPNGALGEGEPWASFRLARSYAKAGGLPEAIAVWHRIAADDALESRQRLQAWQLLRWARVRPSERQGVLVLGVAAEVAVGDEHDLLVAYRDHSVRYLNHSGSAAVVDGVVTNALADALANWFGIADSLAAVIGVWDRAELPPLSSGHTRILMLTPAGKRFGQGPDELMREDPPAAAYLNAATRVLLEVTGQAPG